MKGNKTGNSLMEKTKEELVNIIFRKDASDVSLRAEIKELKSKLSNSEKHSVNITHLEKKNKRYQIACIVMAILVLVLITITIIRF